MPSITLNGPVVPLGTHNMVLRDAMFHSPIQRLPSKTDNHVIEVGLRQGEFTTWIGTWDQAGQRVDGGSPVSVLDMGRTNMRLTAGYALVVRCSSTGTPQTLRGSRLTFTLSLVGGRTGEIKPLVASGAGVADPNSRVAIAALERQVNTGGLASWDDAVELIDPVDGEVYTSSDTSQTITAGAATADGLASVEVLVPNDESRGVLVMASASYLGNGGTSALNLYIGDGTTDHGVMAATATATVKGTPSTSYAGRIEETTTFKVRFDCATNNALIQNQTISVLTTR